MKSGLLLVQSMTSSLIRCISGSHDRLLLPPSHTGIAFAVCGTRSISDVSNISRAPRLRYKSSSYYGARYPFVASSFGLICATSFSISALASCGGDSDNASSGDTSARDILDPLHKPANDVICPFPEESLRHDTYHGVTLNISKLINGGGESSQLSDPMIFQRDLEKALQVWKGQSRRGIWLRIPTTHSHLIPSATNLDFDFRHAEPGYCVLTKWLPMDQESRLPNGPSHQVGVGVLVLHPGTGKMLVVREKSGPAAARKLWKMPTGLTDPGEDIPNAAIRELKEETGLDCIFDHIICFRQAHGGLFNRSDMFFVCLCKLSAKYEKLVEDGKEIELLPQEEEILCADWIDIEDYAKQQLWRDSPLYKEMNEAILRVARGGIEYSGDTARSDSATTNATHGFVPKNLPVGFRPGSNTIYVSSKL